MIEFDCAGCGDHVVSFAPSKGIICSVCQWLIDNVAEPDRAKARAHLLGLPVFNCPRAGAVRPRKGYCGCCDEGSTACTR